MTAMIGLPSPVGPTPPAQRRKTADPSLARSRPAVRPGSLVAVLTGLIVLLLATAGTGAGPASAHSSLESTDPGQGTELATAPSRVQLTFTERVGLSPRSIMVLDPAGHRVDDGKPFHPGGNGAVAAVNLRAGLPKASYAVVWHVVSADSHPVSGTFAFGVGVPAGAAAHGTGDDPAIAWLDGAARTVDLAGMVLLLGGIGFLVLLWPAGAGLARVRRLIVTAWTSAAAGAGALLLLAGPRGAGLGLGGVADAELLGTTLTTRYGLVLVLRLCVLGLAVPLLRRPTGSRRACGRGELAGFAVVAVLSFSVAGHSGQGSWVPLAVTLDAVHLAAASAWLGGLAVLVTGLMPGRRDRGADGAPDPLPALAAALPDWSRTAAVAVTALVGTGLYQAWRQVGGLDPLLGTTYGRLLLAKMAALVVLVVLGDRGRRWIGRHLRVSSAADGAAPGAALFVSAKGTRTVPVEVGAGAALKPLWVSVTAEAVIGAAVLVVTSLLVSSVPARVDHAPPFSATVTGIGNQGDQLTAVIDIAPTRVGLETIHLYTYSSTGAVLPFQTVTGTLAERRQNLGPIRFAFAPTGPGHGTAQGIVVPTAGTWTLTVQVHTDSVTDYAVTTTYTVH